MLPTENAGDGTFQLPAVATTPIQFSVKANRGKLSPTLHESDVNNHPMNELIVISAVGTDKAGVVRALTKRILDAGGNIIESRMAALGKEFAMLLLVAGNWHTLAKLEGELSKIGDELTVSVRRTKARGPRTDEVPYMVDVVCLDEPGIVYNISGFFSSRNIEIAELNTRSYAAAHTGAPMFEVQMTANIPSKMSIAALRDDFMEFCDQHNLDALMEPVKGG